MKLRTKLLLGIGPGMLAVVLLISFLLSPFMNGNVSEWRLRRASTSLSINVIIGNHIKNAAMEDSRYVPFFGSSEYKRFDMFHPSVLADKYDRKYRPFLFGNAGTQSMIHYSILKSLPESFRRRKVVFIISPQWFTRRGQSDGGFEFFNSPLQISGWILGLKKINDYDRYYAGRLLQFSAIQNKPLIREALENIMAGEMPSTQQRNLLKVSHSFLSAEDRLFGDFGMSWRNIRAISKGLPPKYDADKLDRLAWKTGERKSSNNKLQIENRYFNKMLRQKLRHLRGSQKKINYRSSPEFSDFQLVLNEMARRELNVLFIIPPVNGRWMDYTGLSQDMLRAWDQKVRYQLESQGFNMILDLTEANREEYYMQDTIHLGWRGWVLLDRMIAPFLEDSVNRIPAHNMETSFLTRDWDNMPGLAHTE